MSMDIHSTPLGPIEVHTFGLEACDTAVVLLHAAASSPRALSRLAERLATSGQRVIVPALQGSGATRVAAIADPIAASVEVARFVCAQLAPRRVTLFGHSMGGLVALRTGAAAGTVANIVVYEPVAFGVLDPLTEPDASALAWDRRVADTLIANVAAGEREAGVAAFVEAWNEVAWSAIPLALRMGLVAGADRLRDEVITVSRDTMQASAYAGLGSCLTLLRGTRSPVAARLISERLLADIPGSRIEDIADAGHMGPVLRPDAIASAIDRRIRGTQ